MLKLYTSVLLQCSAAVVNTGIGAATPYNMLDTRYIISNYQFGVSCLGVGVVS